MLTLKWKASFHVYLQLKLSNSLYYLWFFVCLINCMDAQLCLIDFEHISAFSSVPSYIKLEPPYLKARDSLS